MSDLGQTIPRLETQIAGMPVSWHDARKAGERRSVVYLHGVPTDGAIFLPFLARTGGVAPDLPGFGRSGKPAHFDYSIDGYRRFLRSFVESLELERFSLVANDWGAVGLALAQEIPERVERLVIIDAVPLLPGFHWHWIARIWRRRVLGELFMGFSTRWASKQLSRLATPRPGPLPDEFVRGRWEHFDQGTQRAILKLYRSAPEHALAGAGARLGELRCPALVVWGRRDPYVPSAFAEAYARALGGPARVEVLEDAGHWPWLDRPDAVGLVADFLAGDAAPA